MDLTTLFAFTLSAMLVLIIPGPTAVLVLAHSLTNGRRATLALIIGVVCGDLIAMSLSLFGLSTLLIQSSVLFSFCKLLGAVYLIGLGITMWRSTTPNTITMTPKVTSKYRLFRDACLVTAFNPKSIVFFIAFFPQFINPVTNQSVQLLILAGIFLILTTLSVLFYACFANSMQSNLHNPRIKCRMHRVTGTSLIAAGLLAAITDHKT